ncbi:MAG: phosphate ABC transporter substrate-binding protein [Candidatus Caenarcaniphilales bacterium]|nr:phosphate ABC transporter substrate-binding protein [Candidatus Caenarcaniphilales bacterium]
MISLNLRSFLITFSILFSLSMFGCTSVPDAKKLTIAGSTTILPISEDWASIFYKEKKVIVNVQGGGSTNGVNLVKSGQVDIGASSRELSEEEKDGLELVEIGKDALAIIVNNQNDIKEITSEQLRKVFTGEITNWKELGGKNRTIQVINRESGSGTRKTFEELVVCPKNLKEKSACNEMILSAVVLNSNAEVKKSVELIADSIGYISYGFLDDKVSSLSLDGIEPKEDEIKSGNYPISRSLYYLVKDKEKSPELSEYLDFITSNEAQEVLYKEGYLPVK